ncbi:zinc-dependent metalloprotease [Novosphingobium beihaiensis]|uniref:Zinc-dependent metalloprotease n=1 Tax=Novosphingobium beihaiensis TaxID=2930389 RepID=A0ABT0BRJ0_9SPHN|nr:zinc-dependent metalloprotease [Novosphingobium beihaiensis]MCJ2187675.1 zinc-dependent metalloprotease [Novosphingobium beihaiensis]
MAFCATGPAAHAGEAPLLPVKASTADGRILLTLPAPDKDGVIGRYLYSVVMRTGLGSPMARLDKAANGPTQLLAFRKIGTKVAVTFENPRFRATGGTAAEQKSVTDSFAFSTVWMTDPVSTGPDGSMVIDISPFLTKDVNNITGRLNAVGKGYRQTAALSVADPASVKAFPDNIEMDALQTFESSTPGPQVSGIAPEPRQVSFYVHHSLIRLPDAGYKPRLFDIRAGGFSTQVVDFAKPLGQNVVYQLANRFRLEKTDPGAARSTVKKPIVFYIDSGMPQPIRDAVFKGVGWWSDAFNAAGLIDAFQVKILPKDADPLDVRYNVVNWDNRLTRGWSFGQVIADPRTGEIVKASVVLGSLRVRQDMVIFESLAGAGKTGTGGPDDPVTAALARMSQLGAHEVGHAIGFMHNFAASTQGRGSVMDYPGPKIGIKDGTLDLSDAYASGIGKWDKYTVDWLYGTDSNAVAAAKTQNPDTLAMRWVTDSDGRSPDAPNPWGSMWDNGPDPVAELAHIMKVRRIAIDRFGPAVLHPGEPLAELRRKFVPVWLFHRYQVDAVAKFIGGIDYTYAVTGDAHTEPVPVAADRQIAAIDGLMATLSSKALTIPQSLVMRLSSGIHGFGRSNPQFDIEVFRNAASAAFDPLVAADAAAQQTLGTLLAPARLTRVFEQHALDPSLPGMEVLLDKLFPATIDARTGAVSRRVAYRTVIELARAAHDPETSPEVSAMIGQRLSGLAERAGKAKGSSEDAAWNFQVARLLSNDGLLERELKAKQRAPEIPPGMPIGGSTGWMDRDWSDGLVSK